MVDIDTFLTILYVKVDEFCKAHPPAAVRPGPATALTRSEVVTLMIFAQWAQFRSERDFYRYARRHLRPLFPNLGRRSQFNRALRQAHEDVAVFALELAHQVEPDTAAYEALDSLGAPVRHAKRRGGGWLDGLSGLGWSNRLGWYQGFHVLTAVNPTGVITGFGFGPGNTSDQALTETFLALRHLDPARLPSVGLTVSGYYVVDKGFEGERRRRHWARDYGAEVICAPKHHSLRPWPKERRRWLAGLRQIVETVHDKLTHIFRMEGERPHELEGFQARLAAKVALHNFAIWLNRQLGRASLEFADLVDW